MAFVRKTDSGSGELFKFDNIGDVIEGIYLGSFDFEGNYGPTKKHLFKTESGVKVVFGQKHLTQILEGEAGKLVKATYDSDKRGKKGNPMKMYTLDIDPDYQASAEDLAAFTAESSDEDDSFEEPALSPAKAAPYAQTPTASKVSKVDSMLGKAKRPTA